MDMGLVREALDRMAGIRRREGEPLALHTSMRVGGPADLFVEVTDEAALSRLVRTCHEGRVPVLVIGGGTNMIVRDGGWRGIAMRLTGAGFSHIEIASPRARAGAGAALALLVRETARRGCAGLEPLTGIPGSVGGAVRMNAGAHGVSFGALVATARLMDQEGRVVEVSNEDLGFVYRGCRGIGERIVLSVELALARGERGEIERRCARYESMRKIWTPLEPSAGCVFKNPDDAQGAGELIDRLGLKGTRVGGAAVAGTHGNVIVNTGRARARDVLMLVEQLKARVREATGRELQTEVVVVGEE
ncbi:MAG: UDP-N-acetylmuramate dehydrogenase [Candidatus Aureabacteria bacterium]|nr:UDP-N-acetylmuramate dehydrogenase [Candidatus Auribacterota bacterium]